MDNAFIDELQTQKDWWPSMIKYLLFLSLVLPLFSEWQPLIYEPLKKKSITLDFVRVINDRFPKMSDEQLKVYLNEAQKVVKEHFDIQIYFNHKKNYSIEEFFSPLSLKIRKDLQELIYDFKKGKGDRNKLVKDIYETLLVNVKNVTLSEMIAYAKPYLIGKHQVTTKRMLANALIATEIKRLKIWLNVKAQDGQSVINEDNYNEWSFWDALGHVQDNFDIVLTNQLIASAEYYGQDIHSALRGGIVAGTTSYRKNSPYNAFVFATSFLFINDAPMIKQLRGGENYSSEEAARYSGAYLAHEIGHMLLRLGHPFGRKACVMSPAKLLLFKQWYHDIDAKKCLLGSDSSMTPGSVTLYYNDAWE